MITLILSVTAVVLGLFAAAAATLAYLKSDSTAKKMQKTDKKSEERDKEIQLDTALKTLKQECLNETESMIAKSLNTFEEKLKSRSQIEANKSQADAGAQSNDPQVYPSKTWYACFMTDQFDEIDFSEMQSPRLSFIIRSTSDTTADVTLNPDFDRSLLTEVKDVCDAVEGSWQNFNTVTVISNGTISKKSKDLQSWKIEKKIAVKLS